MPNKLIAMLIVRRMIMFFLHGLSISTIATELAIGTKKIKIKHSLYEMLQVISVSVFEKIPINDFFDDSIKQYFKELNPNPLNIFD